MVNQESQKNEKAVTTELSNRTLPEDSFEANPSDEIISSLANAYENKRARQVYEWELLRRNSFHATL